MAGNEAGGTSRTQELPLGRTVELSSAAVCTQVYINRIT